MLHQHLIKIGKLVQEGWIALAKKHGIDINITGICPLSHFSFINNEHLKLKTLFTQLMLEKGFLASTVFYSSYAHKEKQVHNYLLAVDSTFKIIANSIQRGNIDELLKTPVCHEGFKRLN